MALSKPPLAFGAFLAERDRCRDRAYVSEDRLLREGFFCNTNRMWDTVSLELADAVAVHPKHRRAAIGTVIALRMAGSPRNCEAGTGSNAILKKVLLGRCAFWRHLATRPFTGRKT